MMGLDYTFNRKFVFLGTTENNARVLVSGHLDLQPVSREVPTVDHGTAMNPEHLGVQAVAFTGKANVTRNLAAGVHSIDHFGPKIVSPAPGYTLTEVRELTALAIRWHNNTLRPGCVHMAKPEGGTPSEALDAGITCPETGQKWGHVWYADVLPDEVRNRFIELMEKGSVDQANY